MLVPFALERIRGWIGYRVDDVHGRGVGKVEAILVDRESGEPQWLHIKLQGGGWTVLPLVRDLLAGAGHLLTPWPKDKILSAPRVNDAGALSARHEREACKAFGVEPTRGASLSTWERRATSSRLVDSSNWAPPARGAETERRTGDDRRTGERRTLQPRGPAPEIPAPPPVPARSVPHPVAAEANASPTAGMADVPSPAVPSPPVIPAPPPIAARASQASPVGAARVPQASPAGAQAAKASPAGSAEPAQSSSAGAADAAARALRATSTGPGPVQDHPTAPTARASRPPREAGAPAPSAAPSGARPVPETLLAADRRAREGRRVSMSDRRGGQLWVSVPDAVHRPIAPGRRPDAPAGDESP